METRGVMPVINTLVERWYTDEFIAARPDLIEKRKLQVETTPENVFLNVFWIYATTEMAPWLADVVCPCLVLTGELDGGCNPRLNRFIADTLPDSELVILDGVKAFHTGRSLPKECFRHYGNFLSRIQQA